MNTEPTASAGATVLIVDDDPEVTHTFSQMLRLSGYQVRVAEDPERGLQEALSGGLDAIILDLRMPLLDGEAFLRGIRGLPASRDVPVVLISAKEELRDIAARYGAAGYLSKPFEAPQLLSLLERVLA